MIKNAKKIHDIVGIVDELNKLMEYYYELEDYDTIVLMEKNEYVDYALIEKQIYNLIDRLNMVLNNEHF